MGLDLRDHNCYLLKKGNQQRVISEFERKQGCKWRCMMLLCISSQLVSVAVLASCWARPWADNPRWRAAERSRDRRTYRQQLQSLCKLQKSIDVVAVLPLRFCWSLCLLLRGSLPLAMMTLVRFDAWPHLAYLSIISAPSLEIVDSISSCWSVLNIFDTFLILYAFWVRGHDEFYICNLCTLTWIWQCFCINAPHWLVFVRSGGIQILLSVWAASVVCRALWKILKVVSGITVQLLSRNFMHNMWQPRGTPDASRLPLDIQGAFDTGKGISTGLVLWPADLRWLLVAGCGGMWRVFFTEEHGADPFAGSEPIWAITGYIRLPRSPFPLWTLLRQWWCHVWTSWWVEFALDIICEYLWYLCGNYQVAGIEDSQSKQGTVLADATEPEPPRSFRTTFLECCCSKVEGALEHARQEKEKLGAWCAQLG